LSLPNDGRHPTLELASQQRRQKTLEALTAQLEALSRSGRVLMIFEDVHWSDPTSLEVLGRTVDRRLAPSLPPNREPVSQLIAGPKIREQVRCSSGRSSRRATVAGSGEAAG